MHHTNQSKQNCPVCEITKETMHRLKPDQSPQKNKKSFKKTKIIFWCLLILVILLGAAAGCKTFFSSGSTNLTKQKNLTQKQIKPAKLPQKNGPQINVLAPDFMSEDILGNQIKLSSFQGKSPVLLVFWATWCGFCAKEKQDLKTFTQKYQDQIKVLAVDSGEPKQALQNYIQKNNINFLMLLDENRKIWNQYLVRGTPSHFLIDQSGRIITLRPGTATLNDLEIMISMLKP